METEKEAFAVLVFPASKDKASLAALVPRFIGELTKACGEAPLMVSPDATAICMLVAGESRRITRALHEAAAHDTRYLCVRVDAGVEAMGLSTAWTWLQRHT